MEDGFIFKGNSVWMQALFPVFENQVSDNLKPHFTLYT